MEKLKRQIAKAIYDETKGIVQSGPFKGMKIPPDETWGNMTPRLIGCYEQELHGPLEQEIAENPKTVLNIGCAEGYYAVGLAMRLPEAKVWGLDTDDKAIEITRLAAEANGVTVNFARTTDEMYGAINSADLIVCDCEGAEIVYLDPVRFKGLWKSTIIVELHDSKTVDATETITKRFMETHEILFTTEDFRNPSRDPILCRLPDDQRWVSVSEGRPCLMHWYIMKPKNSGSGPKTQGSEN